MAGNKHMLTRLLILVSIASLVTPTYYAYAIGSSENLPVHAERIQRSVDLWNNSNQPSKPEGSDDSISARLRRIKTACVKVRASIANRTASLQQRSERYIGVVDKIYNNLVTFADTNKLDIAEDSKQAAALARTAATLAVQDMARGEDTLNCEDSNAGQAAVSLRLNVQAVNEAVHGYRKVVGEILSDIHAKSHMSKGGLDE